MNVYSSLQQNVFFDPLSPSSLFNIISPPLFSFHFIWVDPWAIPGQFSFSRGQTLRGGKKTEKLLFFASSFTYCYLRTLVFSLPYSTFLVEFLFPLSIKACPKRFFSYEAEGTREKERKVCVDCVLSFKPLRKGLDEVRSKLFYSYYFALLSWPWKPNRPLSCIIQIDIHVYSCYLTTWHNGITSHVYQQWFELSLRGLQNAGLFNKLQRKADSWASWRGLLANRRPLTGPISS